MSTQRVDSGRCPGHLCHQQDLQPYIETATLIVTERLVGHYTEARLREIEKWLSAHLACTASSTG